MKDLLSLLRFLDNERDDLSLAEALRSPLFGLSEADLFALAHNRPGLLWDSLRRSEHTDITERLTRLRNRIDFDRPYEVLETALTVQGGRARLTARLGDECTEAIDELLAQALTYERGNLPTLAGFLAWIDARDIEVKRDMDAAGNEVRVMTIHGAKGLEAPIVILADTSQRKSHQNAPQVQASDGMPFWTRSAKETPDALAHVEEDRRASEDRETARLLYVALTRAENWLIVCGAGEKPDAEGRWYGMVQSAAQTVPLRHRWDPPPVDVAPVSTSAPPDISSLKNPPTPFARQKPINPSVTGAAHSLAGEVDDIDAAARGTLIHTLIDALSPLPMADRAAAGTRFLKGADFETGALDAALTTLANPDLAHLFAPDTLAEVSISAKGTHRPIFGRIDRLHITDTTVTAVDFKSNRIVPATPTDVPEGLLIQMGLYALALAQIYPDHRIDTAIVWTETGLYMPLEHAAVTNAAAMFQSLDPDNPAS